MMKESMTLKDIFAVTDREGDQKSRWTKIGVGFLNRDQSINVILDAYPVNGRLHIRDREDRKQKNENEERRMKP